MTGPVLRGISGKENLFGVKEDARRVPGEKRLKRKWGGI